MAPSDGAQRDIIAQTQTPATPGADATAPRRSPSRRAGRRRSRRPARPLREAPPPGSPPRAASRAAPRSAPRAAAPPPRRPWPRDGDASPRAPGPGTTSPRPRGPPRPAPGHRRRLGKTMIARNIAHTAVLAGHPRPLHHRRPTPARPRRPGVHPQPRGLDVDFLSCPGCRCASGCSRCRTASATCWRGTTG